MKITEEIILENQNYINYSNADIMFESLNNLITKYGKKNIFDSEFKTLEEYLKNYVLKSNATRFACDASEHYIKAMLIESGKTWNDMKALGHNLLDLLDSLDNKSRKMIINLIENVAPEFFELDEKTKKIIEYLNIPKEAQKVGNKTSKMIRYHDELGEIISIDDGEEPDTNFSFIFEDEIKQELEKLSGNKTEQHITIKSRFPGQYLIDCNTEFIVNLAFTLNIISKNKRNQSKFDIKYLK